MNCSNAKMAFGDKALTVWHMIKMKWYEGRYYFEEIRKGKVLLTITIFLAICYAGFYQFLIQGKWQHELLKEVILAFTTEVVQ